MPRSCTTFAILFAVSWFSGLTGLAQAEQPPLESKGPALQAMIRFPQENIAGGVAVQVGETITVDLSLLNSQPSATGAAVVVSGAASGDSAAGGVALLPAYAVAGLKVVGPMGELKPAPLKAETKSADLKLAPQGLVGVRLSLNELFPDLVTPGIYTLTFKPADARPSATANLVVRKKLLATIETSYGNMTVEFFPETAPLTVNNFIELAQSGFYDGKTFHRIIKDFMIQGGDPNGDGTGNRFDNKLLKHEGKPTGPKNLRGSLAMARRTEPDTASCQFFICHKDCPFLDYKSLAEPGYVVFGRLVGEPSFATLDKIANVETVVGADRQKSKPAQPVVIKKITVN